MATAHPQPLPTHVESAFTALERGTTAEKADAARQIREELTEALKNATVDKLTQIGNRRHYDETLEKEAGEARRADRPLSLLMVDIDHFKHVNDTHGHDMGDTVLQFVAQAIKAVLQRPGDEVFRYGGEEFAVILPDTDSAGARAIAEVIRKSIEQLSDVSRDNVPSVRISVGCATLPANNPDQTTLQHSADDALRKAKRSGRNQVEVFNPETQVKEPTSAERHAAEALIRDVQGVEALLAALHQGDAATALKRGTELGLFPKDPVQRKALLQALLAEEEKATGTHG